MRRTLQLGLVCLLLVAAAVAAWPQIPGEGWERIGLLGGNITAVAVSPDYDADKTLYAGIAGSGLWRSTDRGTTWTHLSSVPNNGTVAAIAFRKDYSFGRTIPMWVGTREGTVYTSLTDFATLRYSVPLKDRLGNAVPVTGMTVPVAGNYLGWVFAGTSGGGIFRSLDEGGTFGAAGTTTDTDDCRALASGPTGQVLAACASGKGIVYAFSGEWVPSGPSPLVGAVPTALHISMDNGNAVWLGTRDFGLWRSTTAASSWSAACDGVTLAQTAFQVGAVAACPRFAADGEVWEGRSDGLRISTDGAATCGWDNLFASVTGIAFAPKYHGGGLCDAFVATTTGLFLKSCNPAPPAVTATPPAVSVPAVAVQQTALPGIWAGSSSGLLRMKTKDVPPLFLQYNAWGAFNNGIPDLVAVCLAPAYREGGVCGTDQQTLVVADRSLGVFRSQDGGNTWAKLDLNGAGQSTWPANAVANDLAISPKYATGSADETLFAATSLGLLRWDGPTTGWVQPAKDFPYNTTHVAVPLTYDRAGAARFPFHTVYFSTDNATSRGLYFSDNDGVTVVRFTGLTFADITAISASPGHGVTDELLFVSTGVRGTYFASKHLAATAWCNFRTGLSPYVRDMEVAPALMAGGIRLVAATLSGPFYGDFDPANQSDGCATAKYSWKQAAFAPASGCLDTLSVGFAYQGDGTVVAVGTSEDGVHVSVNGGQAFDGGTGYNSLPDDVYNVLPHMRDEKILFASSPSYGVFVSKNKGASFRPWNRGAGGAGNPCDVEEAFGLGMMTDRAGPSWPGWDVIWAGTRSEGIKYRWTVYDTTAGTIDLRTQNGWYGTNVTTGRFERFDTLGTGQQKPAWSTSPTLGMYRCDPTVWANWYANNTGLGATNAKSIRFGYNGPDPVPAPNGQPVAGKVGPGLWNYYTVDVPAGSGSLLCNLADLSAAAGDDPDLYLKYAGPPTTVSYDAVSATTGDERICSKGLPFTLLNENFEGTWGPYGDVPPAGWTILDYGDEAVKAWNLNDWHKFAKGGIYGNVARVYYTPLENQNEWLMTPTFNIPATATSVDLEFDHYFREYTGSTVVQYGRVYYHSAQRGWTLLASYSADTANMAHATLSLLPYRGETSAQILFQYVGYNGWYWELDNVKVSGLDLRAGTWWIGVRGNGAGTNPYELTVTLNGCPLGVAAPAAARSGAGGKTWTPGAYILPGPLAPAAGTVWGTVSNTGAGGVMRGTDTAALSGSPGVDAAVSPEGLPEPPAALAGPAPDAVTWEARNGTGAGALTNLNSQCVIQLPDLTLVAGCNGGVFYSPAPDEGRTTWVESTANIAGACSNNFTDLLRCSNGDVLIGANGTANGGVWLSGDEGRHWMRLTTGFDPTKRHLQDLVNDNPATGTVQYYAGTDTTGLYTRTITAPAYPTVTGLSATSGPTTGGGTITVTGTGFSNACPTGSAADCPNAGPVVLFDDVEAASTAYVSSTTLTCVVPAHPEGPAVVTVRNPDTRRGGSRSYTYTCTAPSGLTNNTAADVSCADTGVLVTWARDAGNWADGGGGSRTYDVLRGAVTVASSLAYGTTTFTDLGGINGTTYTYTVLYRNGCGLTATTAGASAADDVAPGAPVITTIADANACAQSGVQVNYTAGGGATRHDLYRDGVLAVTNYATGATYNPGDTASHTYVVRALSGACGTNSAGSAFADANGTPGAPAITAVTDNNAYAQDGVRVAFTAGSGTTKHVLLRDGVAVADPYVSGALYNPGDTLSHTYVVRGYNGTCFTDSTGVAGTDVFLAPLEVPGSSLLWSAGTKTTLTWSAATGATGYRVYRGDKAELANLPTGAKVCKGYDGAATTSGAVLTATPPSGSFYWYLAVAYNGAGEGPAGAGCVLSSTGACAAP